MNQNINLKIVIKFRDDLIIKNDYNALMFQTDSKYQIASASFFEITKRIPYADSLSLDLITRFNTFFNQRFSGIKFDFLFKYNVDIINELYNCYAEIKFLGLGEDKYYFPNFYNYFQININEKIESDFEKYLFKNGSFKEESDENMSKYRLRIEAEYPLEYLKLYYKFSNQEEDIYTKVNDLLSVFEDFMPYKSKFGNHLFEIVYISEQCKVASPTSKIDSNFSIYEDFLKNIEFKEFDSFNKSYKNGTPNTKNVSITDIEYSWDINNSFLKYLNNNKNYLYPKEIESNEELKTKIQDSKMGKEHGTSILGLLKGESSNDNFEGLTINSDIKLSSVVMNIDKDTYTVSEENALLLAIYGNKDEPTIQGSIILLEVQSSGDYPLEAQPAIFQLIQLATYLQIIVVEAAGNGSKNLDECYKFNYILSDYNLHKANNYWENYAKFLDENKEIFSSNDISTYQSQNSFIEIFTGTNTLTGAILVGALGINPKNNDYVKLGSSNFDTNSDKVKVFALGNAIKTITKEKDDYKITNNFGFTSGAAAIIASIAASLQEIAYYHKTVITPKKMLFYLSNPSLGLDNYGEWHVPNCKKIVRLLLKDIIKSKYID